MGLTVRENENGKGSLITEMVEEKRRDKPQDERSLVRPLKGHHLCSNRGQ